MNVKDLDGAKYGVYLDKAEWHFISSVPQQSDSIENYFGESADSDDDSTDNTFPALVLHVPKTNWNHPRVPQQCKLN